MDLSISQSAEEEEMKKKQQEENEEEEEEEEEEPKTKAGGWPRSDLCTTSCMGALVTVVLLQMPVYR